MPTTVVTTSMSSTSEKTGSPSGSHTESSTISASGTSHTVRPTWSSTSAVHPSSASTTDHGGKLIFSGDVTLTIVIVTTMTTKSETSSLVVTSDCKLH